MTEVYVGFTKITAMSSLRHLVRMFLFIFALTKFEAILLNLRLVSRSFANFRSSITMVLIPKLFTHSTTSLTRFPTSQSLLLEEACTSSGRLNHWLPPKFPSG